MVHAVAVSEHEYDSDDDSSQGESIGDEEDSEDNELIAEMGRFSLSDGADADFQSTWSRAYIDRYAVPRKGILKSTSRLLRGSESILKFSLAVQSMESLEAGNRLASLPPRVSDDFQADNPIRQPRPRSPAQRPKFAQFDSPVEDPDFYAFSYQNPSSNTSAPNLHGLSPKKPNTLRSMTVPSRRRIIWAPDCAVYDTYDAGTYDRRSEPATCNKLTPDLAVAIKNE